jgi:flagellar biosynthesis protein FliR
MVGEHNDLAVWLASSVLLSLRVSPVFVFAPPFTLTRVPRLFLWLFGMGIAMTLVAAYPDNTRVADMKPSTLMIGAARELLLGLTPVLALQLMFGMLYIVGRTIDIQAGFGLALLIDPATRGQTPITGTIFAYLAGVSFFAMNGHLELLRFFAASLDLVPLGAAQDGSGLAALTAYMLTIFLLACGVGAAPILALFVADLSIAMLSRTVPQLNALLLGMQVKALLVIIALPLAIALSGTLLTQMSSTALLAIARLI